MTMGKLYGNDFSQTTISRFEALNLSFKNMCKLRPLLQKWLDDVSNATGSRSAKAPSAHASTSSRSEVKVAEDRCESLKLGLLADSLLRRRKKRTNIDQSIRLSLEKFFARNSKPSVEEVSLIANTLNLDREVVQVWFCNRRQKEKRVNVTSSGEEMLGASKMQGASEDDAMAGQKISADQ